MPGDDSAPIDIRSHPDWRDPAQVQTAASLGDALREARLASGKDLASLATTTRVHERYLTALEQNDFSILPSRVFSIGYVRAYALALGMDEQAAIERFKAESPNAAVPLQAPAGSEVQDVRRGSPRIMAVAVALVAAVVGWNVFQRVSLIEAPRPSDIASIPESWTLGSIPGQDAFTLTAARPAPPDQTTPVMYVTRGLEEELTGLTAEALQASAPAPPVQAAFNPRGAIYGAAANASSVVLQAREAVGIIVHMNDGRVLFARQLAAGESWRAPQNVSASIEVSDPSAFDIYLNGEHGGVLSSDITPLSSLNVRAQALARQTAADVAARAARAQAELQAAQARMTAASAPVVATGQAMVATQ